MMSKKDMISDELMEITPVLATINRQNIYSVPRSYFENLAKNISEKAINEFVIINALQQNKPPFSIPTDYFEGLSSQILNKINNEITSDNEIKKELNEVAPLLNTIDKKMVYNIPINYFEHLEIIIPVEKSTAKVVSINKFSRALRYAAAAVITAIVGFSTYFLTNNDSSIINTQTNIAVVNITEAVDQLSENEIVDYLDSRPVVFDANVTNINIYEELNVQENIKTMSEEEIRQFLIEYAEPGKNTAKES